MEIEHGERRSLVCWLITQEKVLRLWIEEAMTSADVTDSFVEALEIHRAWLAARIAEFSADMAAY